MEEAAIDEIYERGESDRGKRARVRAPAEDRTVEEELLSGLDPLLEDGTIVEVIRPIKSGKEAVVYCCRSGVSLDGRLVAAKVYRPYEIRRFQRDAVYQRGRERGARPDARLLRALGKKTRRSKIHKFNAWIAHEERTLSLLRAAGGDVPEVYERNGPVIVMEYIGDVRTPAPMLSAVRLGAGDAATLYERVLENVELFLRHHRVHADLSAFNILYWDGAATIIDFPQSVDPRYNPDAFSLLIRDIATVNDYFESQGASIRPPVEWALERWRRYVDPNA